MTLIKTSLEFHDSRLSACLFHNDRLVLELRPAYVHKWEMVNGKWIGTGCVQDATIEINEARVLKSMPAVPIEISDGFISVGKTEFNNLIPLPFIMKGTNRLKLQLVNGDAFEISGTEINIDMQGKLNSLRPCQKNGHQKRVNNLRLDGDAPKAARQARDGPRFARPITPGERPT